MRTRARATGFGLVAGLTLAAVVAVPWGPAGAGVPPPVGRLSVGNGASGAVSESLTMVDATGRFVAFTSAAPLVAGDTNDQKDAYVRDRLTDTLERVSVSNTEQQGVEKFSKACGMSDNGRWVVFVSAAPNLAGATPQVFVRDRTLQSTQIVSVSSGEVPGTGVGAAANEPCAISDNGQFVAFTSASSNLAAGDPNPTFDVFLRDRTATTTERISVSSAETGGNFASFAPTMSGNGNVIAFSSDATDLVPGDTNGQTDVLVRVRSSGTTERVSVSSAEAQLVGDYSARPSISNDGRYVAFLSYAANAVAGDTNDTSDIFVRDRTNTTTTRVSLTDADGQIEGPSESPSITDDGTAVTFTTLPDLSVGDGNSYGDIYMRRIDAGTTTLISASVIGATANQLSYTSAVSDDRSTIAFMSRASNLVRNDTNGTYDAFVRRIPFEIGPFGSLDQLVNQQYQDFIGRAPTGGELTEWRARLTNGEYSTDNFIDTLAHGSTWAGRRAPVIRLYWAFFLRQPDLGGLNFWVSQLAAGKSIQWVAANYATSSEFQNTYGALSNGAFVDLIYQNIFERDPDPGGLAYWTGQLNSGAKTRGDVMANFSESSEGKRFLAPQADVVLIWLGMVRVLPPTPTFEMWVGMLQAGTPPELLARGIRTSVQYSNRF